MTRLPRILDIPVSYDVDFKGVSQSEGFLWWKKIVVGPAFAGLSEREKGAVLLHEAGHVKLRHAEKRALPFALAVLRRPRFFWAVLSAETEQSSRDIMQAFLVVSGLAEIFHRQEFEADAFAANCGYGRDLALFFARLHPFASAEHPNVQSRIARLTA